MTDQPLSVAAVANLNLSRRPPPDGISSDVDDAAPRPAMV